jgi:hypothetical protein
MSKQCALCGSEQFITFHHLIPKTCHTNRWFKKHFDKNDMQERGIDICRRCHSFIHKIFSEKQLGRELNTLDKLREHATIYAYLKWARKHH